MHQLFTKKSQYHGSHAHALPCHWTRENTGFLARGDRLLQPAASITAVSYSQPTAHACIVKLQYQSVRMDGNPASKAIAPSAAGHVAVRAAHGRLAGEPLWWTCVLRDSAVSIHLLVCIPQALETCHVHALIQQGRA